jgi:hypothetical protein
MADRIAAGSVGDEQSAKRSKSVNKLAKRR